jgi:hypothetical protein
MQDPDLDPYSINPDPLLLSSTDVIELLKTGGKTFYPRTVPGSSTGRPGHSPAVRGNTCQPVYLESLVKDKRK